MIQTMELMPGVRLLCCRDTRFKQGCLSVQFLRHMDQSEAAMNALLPSVLLRGSRRHPDLRSVTQALDALYGAEISPLVRSVGDYQTTGFYCSFLDERFAMPGDRILQPLIRFLRELMTEYPTEGEGFREDFTQGEKRNLVSAIEANLNDKHAYAMAALLRMVCRNDPFGIPRLGHPEAVKQISPAGLCSHWQAVVRESPIRILYVGSASAEAVAELLRPLIELPDRSPVELPPQTDLRPSPAGEEEETMDIAQARLCMAFTTPYTLRSEENPACQMLNTIYGGGMTSKLFMEVREKRSLCYSIGSGMYASKGILTAAAGIDACRKEETREQILRQMENCAAGRITADEMAAAREALVSGLRASSDSPGAIEGYYATAELSGLMLSPEEYIAAVQAVTVDQVAHAAASMQLHSTYFLKGEPHD